MKIRSVAIYTEPDRYALREARLDEAHFIGDLGGYLNAHRIVNLAVETGCDAIHPGYGFFSELAITRRGIRFIGPKAEVMGDKTARQAMIGGRRDGASKATSMTPTMP